MPDMEPVTRMLELYLAPNEQSKREVVAYHMGKDYARKEICIVVAIFSILFVIFSLLLA